MTPVASIITLLIVAFILVKASKIAFEHYMDKTQTALFLLAVFVTSLAFVETVETFI